MRSGTASGTAAVAPKDRIATRKAAWREAADGAWTSLLVLQSLLALAAIGGGIGLIATGGLGLPLSALETSPFDSFVGPGLLLAVVVGGTQALAVVLQLRNSVWYLAGASVAGFGLLIWIFVQVLVLQEYSLLQPAVFAASVLQLALTVLCLGILPRERP